MEIYHTIYKGGNGEIVEKKSRFIAEVYPVTSEEEAMEILEIDEELKTKILDRLNRRKS